MDNSKLDKLVGISLRVHKDYLFYKDSLKKQRDKLQELISSSKEEADIKYQREMVTEDEMMVLNSITRLEEPISNLKKYLEDIKVDLKLNK